MPQFSRGNEHDQALLGIYTPLDFWAQATLGFWKIAVDITLPDPSCWLPVNLSDQLATVSLLENSIAIAVNQSAIVCLGEMTGTEFIDDGVVSVDTCI